MICCVVNCTLVTAFYASGVGCSKVLWEVLKCHRGSSSHLCLYWLCNTHLTGYV